MEQWLQSFTGIKDVTADWSKTLMAMLDRMAKEAPSVRSAQAGMWGIDPTTLESLIKMRDVMRQAEAEAAARRQRAGVNRDQMARDAVQFERDWNRMIDSFDTAWEQAWAAALPYVDGTVKKITEISDTLNDLMKDNPIGALALKFGELTASILGGVAALRTLRRLIMGPLPGRGGGGGAVPPVAGGGAPAAAALPEGAAETYELTALGQLVRLLPPIVAFLYTMRRTARATLKRTRPRPRWRRPTAPATPSATSGPGGRRSSVTVATTGPSGRSATARRRRGGRPARRCTSRAVASSRPTSTRVRWCCRHRSPRACRALFGAGASGWASRLLTWLTSTGSVSPLVRIADAREFAQQLGQSIVDSVYNRQDQAQRGGGGAPSSTGGGTGTAPTGPTAGTGTTPTGPTAGTGTTPTGPAPGTGHNLQTYPQVGGTEGEPRSPGGRHAPRGAAPPTRSSRARWRPASARVGARRGSSPASRCATARTGARTRGGLWQLYRRGELPGYLKRGGREGNVPDQSNFIFDRLEELMPGITRSKDPAAVVRAFHDRFKDFGASPAHLGHAGQILQASALPLPLPVYRAPPRHRRAPPPGARDRSTSPWATASRPGWPRPVGSPSASAPTPTTATTARSRPCGAGRRPRCWAPSGVSRRGR